MNFIITPNWVATDTAEQFDNYVRLVSEFSREFEGAWSESGAKVGYTVQVRLPQRDVTVEGQALQIQPIQNQTVPITINHQFQVAHSWSSADDQLAIEDARQYDISAGKSMAGKWDTVAAQEMYKQVYFQIGAPGVPLSSDQTWLDGVAKLTNVGVPDTDLCAIIDMKTHSKLLGANIGAFNPQTQISEYFRTGQFNAGALGVSAWKKDSNLATHVTGTFTSSTPQVDGALQTGSTLVTKGWGTYSFNIGDTFYLQGVNAVNPISYVDSGDPQAFVITGALAGSSAATLSFSPAIITSGALQTVTNSPANNASISFVGSTGTVNATMAAQTSKQSLLFDPGAFAFVMADLPAKLAGAVAGRFRSEVDRMSFRYVDQYSIVTDQLPKRFDSIGGVAAILPYFAMRAWS
jgi:hypothetical protein